MTLDQDVRKSMVKDKLQTTADASSNRAKAAPTGPASKIGQSPAEVQRSIQQSRRPTLHLKAHDGATSAIDAESVLLKPV
jgi:hypothetical protein